MNKTRVQSEGSRDSGEMEVRLGCLWDAEAVMVLLLCKDFVPIASEPIEELHLAGCVDHGSNLGPIRRDASWVVVSDI